MTNTTITTNAAAPSLALNVITPKGKKGKALIADAIAKEVDGMRKDAASMLTRAVKIGQYLSMAKAQLPKGTTFAAYCEAMESTFGFKRAMAYNYLALGEAGADSIQKLIAADTDGDDTGAVSIAHAVKLVNADKRAKNPNGTSAKRGNAGTKGGATRGAQHKTDKPVQSKSTTTAPAATPAPVKAGDNADIVKTDKDTGLPRTTIPAGGVDALLKWVHVLSDADLKRLANAIVTETHNRKTKANAA